MSRKLKRAATAANQPAAASPPGANESGPAAPAERPWPSAAVLNVVRVLLFVALGVSAYLAWTSLTRGSVIGCGPESDCDRVLQSRWARWFGIPVSVFAVVVDLLTLWGTLAIGARTSAPSRRRGWIAVTFGALLILGAGLWFVALQFVSVGICPYCMTAHGAGVIAAVVLLCIAVRPEGAGKEVFRVAGYAAVALTVLLLGQILHTPKTGRASRDFAVGSNAQAFLAAQGAALAKSNTVSTSTIDTSPATSSNNSPRTPATNTSMANTTNEPSAPSTNAVPLQVFTPGMKPVESMRRPFKTYGGMVAMDLADVPLIGSETNAHAIISLSDYTCHFCRLMHSVLTEVQDIFKDRAALGD